MRYIKAIRVTFFIGFILILVLLWLDEIFDLPHKLLGAAPTVINFKEAFMESLFVLCILILFLIISSRLEKHIKYLEGLTVICSNCKKVRIHDNWIPVEKWLSDETEVRFSHGVCYNCLKRLYPNEYTSLVKKGKILENV